MNSRVLFAVSLAFLFGCATHHLEKKLDSWVGHDVNELFQSWGPPSSSFDMPDGRKMYTWSADGGAVAVPMGTGAIAVRRGCQTTFTVGTSGRIESWRYAGNAC